MNSLLRGLGGGFGRVLGRFICYMFIGFLIYLFLNIFDIDIKSIISNHIGRLIL